MLIFWSGQVVIQRCFLLAIIIIFNKLLLWYLFGWLKTGRNVSLFLKSAINQLNDSDGQIIHPKPRLSSCSSFSSLTRPKASSFFEFSKSSLKWLWSVHGLALSFCREILHFFSLPCCYVLYLFGIECNQIFHSFRLDQGSATYGTRATLGTPSNFQWHAEPSQVAQNVFIIHTEVAPIGATRSIKNSPVVLIEFVHNIR